MSDPKAARLAAIRAANTKKTLLNETNPQQPTLIVAPARDTQPTARSGDEFADMPPAMALHTVLVVLLAAVAGALAAAMALPTWLPQLSHTLLGPEPKAYWYLARASAFVAYTLLWLSVALGLTMTNKLARLWPGGPVAFDLHQHASLLGLAFATFHALILLGDHYMNYTVAQILTPFASAGYKPLEVGLGQVAFYLLAIVGLSFYVRQLIGRRAWRLIHFLSFLLFAGALAHGALSGTDSGALFAQALYWLSGASVLFLTIYRVLVSVARPAPARALRGG